MQEQTNVPFTQRLNLDQILGHDCDYESYNRVPIADFGLNMLKSMGWYEGKGIGKNPQNAIVRPIVYIPNYDRAGLGARKDLPASLKKRRHLDKATEPDANGRIKNYLEIDGEKFRKIEKNARVRITDGKFEGLKGVVMDINEAKKECYIELEINDELVRVNLSKVKLLQTRQNQDYVDFEMGERFRGDSKENRNSSDEEETLPMNGSTKVDKKDKNGEKRRKKAYNVEKNSLKWISAHIWVRVINKHVQDGRLYQKKVYVNDILDEYSFSAIDEKGNLIDELREKDVQTVMPKQNGLVKVLTGENKDKIAVLLERDKTINKIQVQLVDNMETEEYTQDDCSMYEEKM